MKKQKNQLYVKQARAGYLFLLPGLVFLVVFMGYPLLRSLYLSFTKYNFAFDTHPVWAGFANYAKMFQDEIFLAALKNTSVFALVFFPVIMVLSLIIAMLLDRGVRGSGFFRTCIFLPMVVPLSLSGIIFQWLLHQDYGLINSILREIGLGFMAQNWLGAPRWAMFSIIIVSIWKNIGMLVIFFMAGLRAIPNDILEAATVDGASTLQRTFRVILPNLKETYVIAGIWAIICSFKVFEQPFIMTNGGPGTATLVLYQYAWQQAFRFYDMGYASTIAYFIGFVILIFSGLNMYLSRGDQPEKIRRTK